MRSPDINVFAAKAKTLVTALHLGAHVWLTSAATTFFEPVSFGDRTFTDGGFGADDPVDTVEAELLYFPSL